jgi:hypothetical protein
VREWTMIIRGRADDGGGPAGQAPGLLLGRFAGEVRRAGHQLDMALLVTGDGHDIASAGGASPSAPPAFPQVVVTGGGGGGGGGGTSFTGGGAGGWPPSAAAAPDEGEDPPAG